MRMTSLSLAGSTDSVAETRSDSKMHLNHGKGQQWPNIIVGVPTLWRHAEPCGVDREALPLSYSGIK